MTASSSRTSPWYSGFGVPAAPGRDGRRSEVVVPIDGGGRAGGPLGGLRGPCGRRAAAATAAAAEQAELARDPDEADGREPDGEQGRGGPHGLRRRAREDRERREREQGVDAGERGEHPAEADEALIERGHEQQEERHADGLPVAVAPAERHVQQEERDEREQPQSEREHVARQPGPHARRGARTALDGAWRHPRGRLAYGLDLTAEHDGVLYPERSGHREAVEQCERVGVERGVAGSEHGRHERRVRRGEVVQGRVGIDVGATVGGGGDAPASAVEGVEGASERREPFVEQPLRVGGARRGRHAGRRQLGLEPVELFAPGGLFAGQQEQREFRFGDRRARGGLHRSRVLVRWDVADDGGDAVRIGRQGRGSAGLGRDARQQARLGDARDATAGHRRAALAGGLTQRGDVRLHARDGGDDPGGVVGHQRGRGVHEALVERSGGPGRVLHDQEMAVRAGERPVGAAGVRGRELARDRQARAHHGGDAGLDLEAQPARRLGRVEDGGTVGLGEADVARDASEAGPGELEVAAERGRQCGLVRQALEPTLEHRRLNGQVVRAAVRDGGPCAFEDALHRADERGAGRVAREGQEGVERSVEPLASGDRVVGDRGDRVPESVDGDPVALEVGVLVLRPGRRGQGDRGDRDQGETKGASVHRSSSSAESAA